MVGTRVLPVGRGGRSADDDDIYDLLEALDESQEMKRKAIVTMMKRSRQILEQGLLRSLDIKPKDDGGKVVRAESRGSAPNTYYSLMVTLLPSGEVGKLSCECPYFANGDNSFCKHTVALLMKVSEALGREGETGDKCEPVANLVDEDEDCSSWSVSKLKEYLRSRGVDLRGIAEKRELVDLMVRDKAKRGKAPASATGGREAETSKSPTTSARPSSSAAAEDGGWFTRDSKLPSQTQRQECAYTQVAPSADRDKPAEDSKDGYMDDFFDEWLGMGSKGKEEEDGAKPKGGGDAKTEGTRATGSAMAAPSKDGGAKKDNKDDSLDDIFDTWLPSKEKDKPNESLADLISSKDPEKREVDVSSWKEELPTTKKRKVSFREKLLKLGFKL